MNVKLLNEDLKDGRKSLFLNVYLGNGKYQRKSLGLYLKPESNNYNKEYNKAIIHEAEIIRNELELNILNKRLGKVDPKLKYNNSFLDYIERIVDHRYETGVNYDAWHSVRQHLLKYTNGQLEFDEVDQIWLEGFRSYLLRNLSQNSAATYFNKIKNALHKAYRERIYEINLADIVAPIKSVNSNRQYLTAEEVVTLIKSDCKIPELKKAFLFGCFTGLRWSDVMNIRWENVYEEKNIYYLRYKQKKTRNNESLPLSEDALQIMGSRKGDDDKIFPKIKYSAWNNSILSNWVLISGIKKHITFHCARHTHATLLLSNDVGLYTVSKLLGHKDIKTTEIYAKLLDHKKVEAVNKLPRLL